MGRLRCSLADLPDLDLDDLTSLWSKVFGSSPPPGAKRELWVRLLAYGMQERAHGSLPRASQKGLNALTQLKDDRSSTASAEHGSPTLRLGARLVRSWNGATHEVTVLERGFAYRGRQYRSLSEIAEAITGAHWSGPRFFGLRKSRAKSAERASA
ncbi:hypothetical protein GCM10009105_10710 [Dokdonella soli]|uniref:DUF2924 domain-containing protein n=2 Tax=Dokdonella soli TaxID=529810 RepID=A0ABP3TK30_9GAMM